MSTVVHTVSPGEANDNDLLGVSDESMASEHTDVKETFSDRDEDFDTDLPFEYKESSQASPAKGKVADKDMDEGNSEKIVPALEKEYSQGFQSADSIHAINLLTSCLFTVNTMQIN